MNKSRPTVKEVCDFLANYSSRLLACGATCIRLEKNVDRIAQTYGKNVDVTIMPRHISLTVSETDGSESQTVITSIRQAPISFNINTRLSRLSWTITDREINIGEARKEFDRIITSDSQNSVMVLLLVTLANASFCRLFGGDAVAMAVVAMATLAGYWIKTLLLKHGVDIRVTFAVCSFISAILGATDGLFDLGSTPELAIGTSVLYLVPGIPLLNSFSDMLYRHYICSLSRLMDALVLTACLSTGLCAGMALMNVKMF